MSRVLGVLVVLVSVVAVAEARPKKSTPEAAPVAAPEPAPAVEEDGDEEDEDLPHRVGPAVIDLGDGVEIDLPAGMTLYERTEARAMMEASGDNPEGVLAIVVPSDSDLWSLGIDLDEVGYVSDGDAGKLDASEMLGQIDRGTRQQNIVRRTKGVAEMFVDGWSSPPSYDRANRALRWGIKLHTSDSSEGLLLNEFTNVLGRGGYIGLNLVANTDDIVAARAEAATTMAGVRFQAGHRYQDFDPARDRNSGMNLRNLVVGTGVVAAGSKLGVFAAIAVVLKKVAIAIAAAAAGVWKWLTGRRSKNAES